MDHVPFVFWTRTMWIHILFTSFWWFYGVVRLKFCKISIFTTPGTHVGLYSGQANFSQIYNVFNFLHTHTCWLKRNKHSRNMSNFEKNNTQKHTEKKVLHTHRHTHGQLRYYYMTSPTGASNVLSSACAKGYCLCVISALSFRDGKVYSH